MEDIKKEKIINVYIEDEMKKSYLTYAMSVIVSRALPDVRDGLKPVHRRILYAMNEAGLTYGRPFKKSARVVGDVMAKYHPHGDQAIYDSLVRLAQDFSMRYPLVNGQGNFGSIDGDPPAAMRYTEVRLHKIASLMLADIGKNTVDFAPNYDESAKEPVVLPSGIPNLLINGSSGIAVGMSTNIPPHNINEVIDGIVATINNPNITIDELMKYIPAPDFPTGGIILGREGVIKAYKTGKGTIKLRAKVEMETMKNGRNAIIVREIPYQVNKTNLITKIANLVKEGKIDYVSEIRDESDRDGIRIVIELSKHAEPKIVLNQLLKHSSLQISYGIILLALVDGAPKVLNLKELITHYIAHRKEVVIRRTKYDLEKAQRRAHILEGLLIALDNIDEVIELIKKSANVEVARNGLMKRFKLTEVQAQAILDMQLQKLTNLETSKLKKEYAELQKLIKELKAILASEKKVYDIIKNELLKVKEEFGDDRKTQIAKKQKEISEDDIIAEEDMVITITHHGFIKRIATSSYRKQKRGGVGITAATSSKDDFVEHIFTASTKDYILLISNRGKAYWIKVHEIPKLERTSKGKNLKLFIRLSTNESIKAYVPIKSFDDKLHILMVTANGIIKKTALSAFEGAKARGISAITLDKGDNVIKALLVGKGDEVVLATRKGLALRISVDRIRAMGRAARGVKGIALQSGDELAGMEIADNKLKMVVITEKGYGKLLPFKSLTLHSRGTKGQIYIKIDEQSGEVSAIASAKDDDSIMVITSQGMVIKVKAGDIRTVGRAAKGVKVISVKETDFVVDVARIQT